MREHPELIELIGSIHDAALDPALWTGVLGRITVFVGAQASALISKNIVSGSGEPQHYFNIDPHYMRTYAEIYAKFSPIVNLPRFGEVVSIPELVSYDDYRRGRFYEEWLQPQGWLDIANTALEKSPPNYAVALSLIPHNRMLNDEMRRRIALIAPHARRAWLIGRAMAVKQGETATFVNALNSISASVFLVDAGGRIVHTNIVGDEMLYAGDCVRSVNGGLTTHDAQTDQTLRECFAVCAYGDAGLGTRAVALPLLGRDGERYVAHVLPLTSGELRIPDMSLRAVAAVFVRKAALGPPLGIIAQTYQLTPRELRVLHAIVEIGGVPETAEALGVAQTTVKTHLYRLYDKTGARRQADLVKLLAGFSNPLVG